jgi:ATP synthase protein I
MRVASVGIEFSVSTVIGMLGGRWLDGKLGTDPWLMIVGLLLGLVAGFRSLIRTARRVSQTAPRDNAENHESPDD